jgi:transcriptional regulator with XRE-family HTH domain
MTRKIAVSMAIPSSSGGDKSRTRRSKQSPKTDRLQSPLRTVRIKKGLTQVELAQRAGMHRNSIRKLENGATREVTAEHANALSAALKTTIADLGLRVRAAGPPRSIQIRRLSPEQRQLIDELLSLAPDDYAVIRGALESLRKRPAKQPRRSRRK